MLRQRLTASLATRAVEVKQDAGRRRKGIRTVRVLVDEREQRVVRGSAGGASSQSSAGVRAHASGASYAGSRLGRQAYVSKWFINQLPHEDGQPIQQRTAFSPTSSPIRPTGPSSRSTLPLLASSLPRRPISPSHSRAFSTSPPSRASAVPTPDLSFPTKSNPTPWEIFHFSRSEDLTPNLVKSRYYELCRLFHPDTGGRVAGKGKGRDTSLEFRQITTAYDVLRSPSKRAMYLRTGGTGFGNTTAANGDVWRRNSGYDFSRGRPMRDGGARARGPYPSAAWDWADPHNPHFRPSSSTAQSAYPGGGATGWNGGAGQLGTNGTLFLGLLVVTVIITPLSVWSLVEPASILGQAGVGFEARDESEWRGLSGGRDKRHYDAAKALEEARREARVRGPEKREALKKRVRQIERVRALERAMEVENIAREKKETGHLLLGEPEVVPSTSTRSSI